MQHGRLQDERTGKRFDVRPLAGQAKRAQLAQRDDERDLGRLAVPLLQLICLGAQRRCTAGGHLDLDLRRLALAAETKQEEVGVA